MLKHPLVFEEYKSTCVIMQQIVLHEIPASLNNSRDFSLKIVDMNDEELFSTQLKENSDVTRAPTEILLNTTTVQPIDKDFKVMILNVTSLVLYCKLHIHFDVIIIILFIG